MAGTAPFQMWMDLNPIASATGTGGTVTVTTSANHGLWTGAVVQLAGFGSSGTAYNGVGTATVTSSTAFTYVIGTATASASVGSAVLSVDLLPPVVNYASGTARNQALYIELGSLNMGASGDGQPSVFNFVLYQDVTPSTGPWFTTIPDNTRFRLVKANTGVTPAADYSDVLFAGYLDSVDSQLNRSGQGTTAQVSVIDLNGVLDSVMSIGQRARPVQIDFSSSMIMTSGTATVKTKTISNYSSDTSINIYNVIGGGTSLKAGTGFNVQNVKVATATPDTNTFTYVSGTASGTALGGSSGNYAAITSISTVATAKSYLKIGFGQNHYLSESNTWGGNQFVTKVYMTGLAYTSGGTFTLDGTASSGAAFVQSFNGDQSTMSIKLGNASLGTAGTALLVSLADVGNWQVSGAPVFSYTNAKMFVDASIAGQIVPITGDVQSISSTTVLAKGTKESAAVAQIIRGSALVHGTDQPLKRLIDLSDLTGISVPKNSSLNEQTNNTNLVLNAGTLRNNLETIMEAFTGQDQKVRRYWVDVKGRLNYSAADTGTKPTFANAPYAISITGNENPNIVGKSTITPFSLGIRWDQATVKQAVFINGNGAITQTYLDAAYTSRPGGPVFDSVVDYSVATGADLSTQISRASKSFFLERNAPILAGSSFEIRGAGTASWNNLGFNSGYAINGTATVTGVAATGGTMTYTYSGLAGTVAIGQLVTTATLGTANAGYTITGGTVVAADSTTFKVVGTGTGTVTGLTGTATTFSLVSFWQPGQWVEITAAPLGLSGLYRIEQVDWSLEPGSFYQIIRITFNRRGMNALTSVIASGG